MEMFSIEQLKNISKNIRLDILDMIYKAKKGHIGGSFSVVDIMVSLFSIFDFNNSDRFILSKGHASAALYATLRAFNYLDDNDDIFSFVQNGTIFGSHPDTKVPTVNIGTGSLGHGLSFGCGVALQKKIDKEAGKVVVVCGDGEMSEGSVWEAMLFASKHSLNNLLLIVDRNRQMVLDYTDDVVNLGDLSKKISDFGFKSINLDGHKISDLIGVIESFNMNKIDTPMGIVANTIKGKGVSFMEKNIRWHHSVPNNEEYKIAKEELGS